VYALARTPLNKSYIADIKDKVVWLPCDGSFESIFKAVKESRPDLVYHMATHYTGAHGPKDTQLMVEANIRLGAYLLEAMAEARCKHLVYASSIMTCYQGEAYRPLNLYAATKQAFSDLMDYYTDEGLLHTVTLVLSDTYGPGDHRPKILNLIRDAVQSSEQLAMSDGTQEYDVVYIDDVIGAFCLAGEQLLQGEFTNKRFQVCAEQPLTLRETVELMLRVNGVHWQGGWGQRLSSEREMRMAVRFHPVVPGWKQCVHLEEGLRRFWKGDL